MASTPDARIDHPALRAAEARLSAWSTAEVTDTARSAAAAAQPKATAKPRRQGTSTRQLAMARRTTTRTSAQMIEMAQRGVFLGTPGQTPPEPVQRQPRTGRTV